MTGEAGQMVGWLLALCWDWTGRLPGSFWTQLMYWAEHVPFTVISQGRQHREVRPRQGSR